MWWTAIKTFFGDKVMSYAGIFIGIFALIIGVFIWSNSSVILSKFGFETATNLKAEVTRLQGAKGGASATSMISGRSAGALRSSSCRCAWSRAFSAWQPKPRAMAMKSGV